MGSEGSVDVRRDVIGYLDYQVLQWYKQIPEDLQFDSLGSPEQSENESKYTYRQRVMLYLRMNQSRILIYRPVLHSANSISQDKLHAQTVVDVAKDTVRILAQLDQVSDIYRSGQACLNYFLVAALAVLFLAVCHAPLDFGRQVRVEFCMALDLISHSSTRSYISNRLWQTIRGLRQIGEKLGVLSRPTAPHSEDAHSTAALAMAGLAGHPMDNLSVSGPVSEMHELDNSPRNGMQMSHQLTNLFEAVGEFSNLFVPGTTPEDSDHPAATVASSMDAYSAPSGGMYHGSLADGFHRGTLQQGELSRVIHDLF